MSNEFDTRYPLAEGTPDDIIIGTGEYAISLSAIHNTIRVLAGIGVFTVNGRTGEVVGLAEHEDMVERISNLSTTINQLLTDDFEKLANRDVPFGYPSLNSRGKLTVDQLEDRTALDLGYLSISYNNW